MALFNDLKRPRAVEAKAGGIICNIRGTNGSGKSTAVMKLLSEYTVRKIKGISGPNQPEAYELKIPRVRAPVFVLGTYERVTGGVDNIIPYDLILDLLVKYIPKGHLIFEGLIVTGTYGRLLQMLEPHAKHVILAYMDTPLKTCIANVKKRRDGREDVRDYDPKHLIKTHKRCQAIRGQIEERGLFRQEDISMKDGADKVLQWLRE